jgi:RNA polymerase sigma factor (sigma-70 family)
MVVNAFLDARRRRSASEKPTATSNMPVGAERDHADTHAERAAMWAKLAELPRAQRAVLVLRYYEDLDDSNIAELMGCGSSTVRSNAARGLASLRKEWTRA